MQRVFRVFTPSLNLQKKSVLCWSLKSTFWLRKSYCRQNFLKTRCVTRRQDMLRNRWIGIIYWWMMVKKIMLKERETAGKIMKWRNRVQNTVQVLKILIVSSSYIEFSCVHLSNLSLLLLRLWPNHSTLRSGYQNNCVCLICSQIQPSVIALHRTPWYRDKNICKSAFVALLLFKHFSLLSYNFSVNLLLC